MTIKALHHAARRYCIDRAAQYRAIFLPHHQAKQAALVRRLHGDRAWPLLQQLGLQEAPPPETVPYPAAADEQALPERCALLDAILDEIEHTAPEDFGTVAEAREALLRAGQQASVWQAQYLEHHHGEPVVRSEPPDWTAKERAAVEEERSAYLAYLAALTEEDAARAEPVPYRRVLSPTKRRRVRRLLRTRLGVAPGVHYWYPLEPAVVPAGMEVLAVQDAYFHKEVGAETLRTILRRRGITRVWQIEESQFAHDYEQDPHWCTFYQTGGETYWSSHHVDWVVYASHERSLTFAGHWLVRAVEEVWPNWEQRVYVDYDYD